MTRLYRCLGFLVFVSCLWTPQSLWAQLGPPPPAPPVQATQGPLSGRTTTAGAVQATETPVPGITTSINTISPQIQVSGDFAGSTVGTSRLPFNGKLSLRDAIARGIDFNLGAQDLAHSVAQADGEERVARSSLLPNLSGSLSENVEQSDLAALGFKFNSPIAGFSIPSVVGPFNYFDLQAELTQSVLNITARDNVRASRDQLRALQLETADARNLVVLAVGGAYLQVIAAKARLASAQAQLATATAILQQSQQQHAAGTLAVLPLDQNQVQQLTQQQQLTTLQNDLAKQKINLARMIGLRPDDNYDITDDVPFAAPPALDVQAAVAQALSQRTDLQAAAVELTVAQQQRAAASAERLPSASIAADYGVIGVNPSQSHGIFAVSGSVSIPLWMGGKAGGDVEIANAAVLQRQAELEDARSEVEAQVREAYLDLQAAASQVDVAQRNLQTAHETLSMAQMRFQAGVINTVELVQSQQSVATAELDYINSVYAHNVAKLSLARALGIAAQSWPQFLRVP